MSHQVNRKSVANERLLRSHADWGYSLFHSIQQMYLVKKLYVKLIRVFQFVKSKCWEIWNHCNILRKHCNSLVVKIYGGDLVQNLKQFSDYPNRNKKKNCPVIYYVSFGRAVSWKKKFFKWKRKSPEWKCVFLFFRWKLKSVMGGWVLNQVSACAKCFFNCEHC